MQLPQPAFLHPEATQRLFEAGILDKFRRTHSGGFLDPAIEVGATDVELVTKDIDIKIGIGEIGVDVIVEPGHETLVFCSKFPGDDRLSALDKTRRSVSEDITDLSG